MGADESKPEALEDVQLPAVRLRVENERVKLIGRLKCMEPKRYTLQDWRSGLADAFGFPDTPLQCSGHLHQDCSDGFCISRQQLINFSNKLSLFRFKPRSKFSKIATYLEYHHVPAHVSAVENFRVHQVICAGGGNAVLHLVREGTNRFVLVGITSRRFLGTFGNYFSREGTMSFRGRISADGNHLLVAFIEGGLHVVHLYRLVEKCQSLVSKHTLDDGRALLDLAFDPRHAHEFVVLVTRGNRTEHSASLTAVTLHRSDDWSVKAEATHAVGPAFLACINYTPCGSRLILLFIQHDEALCRSQKYHHTYVHDSDTLHQLPGVGGSTMAMIHRARSADGIMQMACIAHSCPTNYRPMFSRCGTLAALPCLDAPATELRLLRLPPPLNLQHVCRVLIWQCCSSPEAVDSLPLPPPIKSYLNYGLQR